MERRVDHAKMSKVKILYGYKSSSDKKLKSFIVDDREAFWNLRRVNCRNFWT